MAPVSLTCIKCSETFKDRPSQKVHYDSDWHKYNIIRLVKGATAITQKEHTELVKKQTYLQLGPHVPFSLQCLPCKKRFKFEATRQTHLRSKKHKNGLLQETIAKIKARKEQERTAKVAATAEAENESQNPKECDFCPGKNGKIAVFACAKDYSKHIATKSHKERVLARKIEHRRRSVLDKMDEDLATKPKAITMGGEGEQMEGIQAIDNGGSEDMDEGDWDEMEEDENEEEANDTEEDEDAPIPPTRCLFCAKIFTCIDDNLGHMERQHLFIIPHRHAANMKGLLIYLGTKVGVDHKCLDCSRTFPSRKAVRNHMKMKPHHEIRFEGEYDGFFDIAKILDNLAYLPIRAGAENDLMFMPLSDGTLLTHRDMKVYFKQRLSEKKTLKRLNAAGVGPKALSYMGKVDPKKSVQEQRKRQKVQLRSQNILTALHNRKEVNRQMKANKLQPHLRPQVINAG